KVRNDPPAIKKLRPTIHLDLSAIAKGYGVDAISELLREHGIQHSLVEIGGEVRAIGSKHGTPWTIGIERPEPLQSGIYAKVQLHNQSLATSGNYRNYFEKDGVRYSHTIDPQTGAPVTHSLASVSVVAESCMDADAWATALMVVGLDRGKSLAEQRGLSAYFITHAANGEYSDATTSTAQGLFASASNEQPVRPSSRWGTAFSTFLLALGVFAVATLGLAIGVILANRELKGTCGGASGLKDDEGRPICEMCSIPPDQCDRFREEASTSGAKK
ncbi:MAG: FAD:protein FMN transferase, partial [Planctomycetaceae bacterium]|nr:FAD:protein FMN transferase [Planctomycetaceae bacterium]